MTSKRFVFTMKNKDGEKGELTIEAENLTAATNIAIEDANNGYLKGTGWTVYLSREVKK